jgi:hypothetical protein
LGISQQTKLTTTQDGMVPMMSWRHAQMHQSTVAAPNLAIQVRLQNDLASAIESFRRGEPDIPTRPEAIRRLLQRALALPSARQAAKHRTMPTTASANAVSEQQAPST